MISGHQISLRYFFVGNLCPQIKIYVSQDDNSLEGSLTTLLIAHVATLQSGRQLEFYVTLLGVFYCT